MAPAYRESRPRERPASCSLATDCEGMGMTAGVLMAAMMVAVAQPPVVRQKLADLAYVLGEAHALAGACGRPGDLRWRARMNRLLDLEAREPAFRSRLADSFNA